MGAVVHGVHGVAGAPEGQRVMGGLTAVTPSAGAKGAGLPASRHAVWWLPTRDAWACALLPVAMRVFSQVATGAPRGRCRAGMYAGV